MAKNITLKKYEELLEEKTKHLDSRVHRQSYIVRITQEVKADLNRDYNIID